jgi:hypothetical protein
LILAVAGLRALSRKGLLSSSDISLSHARICAFPEKMSLWDNDVAAG